MSLSPPFFYPNKMEPQSISAHLLRGFHLITILIANVLFIALFSSPPCWAKSTKPIRTLKILIIGDSLTEGYGVKKSDAYPYQAEMLLKKQTKKQYKEIKIINAGSSGSTTASALSRLKWHIRSKPDILILALGGNDGLRGFKPEATRENLHKTILLAKNHKIKVILAGMKLPLNYGEPYRQQFEAVFTDLVKKHKIGFIPFLLEGVGGEKILNLPDGIHPNEKGHKIIAKTIVKFLKEFL